MAHLAGGLVRACHPEPTAAVTVLATVLLISAGNTWGTCVLGAVALFTGQLSIGWSNDLIDRGRDAGAGRADKPLTAGALTVRALTTACALASVLTVVASLALGWRPGLIHLAAVAAGWAYNLGLKSHPLSPLPYVLAFGALPLIATQALRSPVWPPAWIPVAAGLIGAAAHFGNVLPDLADDVAAGVLGLPQRLGRTSSAGAAAALTLAATLLVTLAPRTFAGWLIGVVLIAVTTLQALGIHATVTGRSGEAAFFATVLCAAIDVALLVGSGRLG